MRESDIRGADAVSVGALLWMYPPLATNFWFGQSEIFLCFVLVLMLVALRRNHDRLAGLCLAAAALLRAYPLGLIGYLLVLSRWRALVWTGIGVLMGGAVTIAFVGWSTIQTYSALIEVPRGMGLFGISTTLNNTLGLVKHPANLNLGWFVKWLYDRTASLPLPAYMSILAALAEVLAVAVCFRATRQIRTDDPDWRGFGLWIITVTLISPLAWFVYLCCFLPMIAGMAAAQWNRFLRLSMVPEQQGEVRGGAGDRIGAAARSPEPRNYLYLRLLGKLLCGQGRASDQRPDGCQMILMYSSFQPHFL